MSEQVVGAQVYSQDGDPGVGVTVIPTPADLLHGLLELAGHYRYAAFAGYAEVQEAQVAPGLLLKVGVESGNVPVLRLVDADVGGQRVAEGKVKVGTRLADSCRAPGHYVGPWRRGRDLVAGGLVRLGEGFHRCRRNRGAAPLNADNHGFAGLQIELLNLSCA